MTSPPRTGGERRAYLDGWAGAVCMVADHSLATAAAELRLMAQSELRTLTKAERSALPGSVHTCFAGCPCHTGGQPTPDFIEEGGGA